MPSVNANAKLFSRLTVVFAKFIGEKLLSVALVKATDLFATKIEELVLFAAYPEIILSLG